MVSWSNCAAASTSRYTNRGYQRWTVWHSFDVGIDNKGGIRRGDKVSLWCGENSVTKIETKTSLFLSPYLKPVT